MIFVLLYFDINNVYSTNTTEIMKLKSNASNVEILEAMKHPQNGIGFLTPHPSLPLQTFVSADAVQWLHNHTETGMTVKKAIKIMQVKYIY